jgi:hypothetical protein
MNSNISHKFASQKGGDATKLKWDLVKLEYLNRPNRCAHCHEALPYDKRRNKYCSNSCSAIERNTGVKKHSCVKEKIRQTAKSRHMLKFEAKNKKCKVCNSILEYARRNRITCSEHCRRTLTNIKKGETRITKKRNNPRRSKNEMLFAELCLQNFGRVLTNEPMFNGWDADVILVEERVAVLWNGIWHFKKITKKHSVKQVQTRDKIKIEEIRKAGYVPYVIEDLGQFNKEKVAKEFEKFVSYIKENRPVA